MCMHAPKKKLRSKIRDLIISAAPLLYIACMHICATDRKRCMHTNIIPGKELNSSEIRLRQAYSYTIHPAMDAQ